MWGARESSDARPTRAAKQLISGYSRFPHEQCPALPSRPVKHPTRRTRTRIGGSAIDSAPLTVPQPPHSAHRTVCSQPLGEFELPSVPLRS